MWLIFGVALIISLILKATLWVSLSLLFAMLVTSPIFHRIFYSNKKYKKALECEKNQAYKEACRLYVEAILEGSTTTEECKQRFLQIWNRFGPFNYRTEIEAKTEEYIKSIENEPEPRSNCGEAGLSIWIRDQDAFLQMIDVLLGRKERLEPLKEVTLFGNKRALKSVGPFVTSRVISSNQKDTRPQAR